MNLSFTALIVFFISVVQASALSLASEIVVSVPEQQLAVIDRGKIIARYPISTSKFGVGDEPSSYRTPLGTLYVAGRFGDHLAAGSVIQIAQPDRRNRRG